MSKPTYNVYIVTEVNEQSSEWTQIGVAFAHGKGNGLNIVIKPGLSVSGRLVLLEPKEKSQEQGA